MSTEIESVTNSRLQVAGVVKRYDGRKVVDTVSLRCGPGEVVGLIGHNGAGKSTLSKIIAGLEHADEGSIAIDGTAAQLRSAEDAIRAGIGLVPQRLAVVPTLTVRENILLGSRLRRLGSEAEEQDSLEAVAESLGLGSSLDRRAELLRPAGQRLVTIARTLVRAPRVLILDEPTASFSQAEVDRLFAIVRTLKDARGIGVIYVSHRLEEVLALADRVVALSQGVVIADRVVEGLDKSRLADLMAGRHVDHVSEHPVESSPAAGGRGEEVAGGGAVVLRCKDVSVGRKLRSIDLTVRAGEVVGLTGLVGSGRTSLLNALCGTSDAKIAGSIEVSGQPYVPKDMRAAIASRIAYLPEHRARNSIIPGMTVRENVTLPTLREDRGRLGAAVSTKHERKRAAGVLDRLAVEPSNAIDMPMSLLSGGNQQKALLARWLLVDFELFVMDEPTEGVDVRGREEIYRLIGELTASGAGVLLSSSDIEEVVSCCDRVLVLRSGTIGTELRGEELTVERVSRVCIE